MTAGAAAGQLSDCQTSLSPQLSLVAPLPSTEQLPAITRTHHTRKKLRGRADDVKLSVDCHSYRRLGRASAAVLHTTLTLRVPLQRHTTAPLQLQSDPAIQCSHNGQKLGAFCKNMAWTDIL